MNPPSPSVLITGAARGIGRELVRQYLAAGATVIAATRAPEPALAALPGAERLVPLRLDVADPASIAAAADELAARVSRLDLLFNNAGLVGRDDGFASLKPEAFFEVLRVNTLGPVLVARSFLPLLAAAPHGRVLTLTSRTGVLFENTSATAGSGYAYGASKAALHRLIPALAADLRARGVTAVGVDPGFVETDMTRGFAGDRHQLSPETCARGLRAVADALTPAHAGALLRWNGAACRWHAPAETAEDRQLVPPVLPDPFVLAASAQET